MIDVDNVYLGDAYELIKQIPDNSVDLIYTDIPYKIHTQGYGYIADEKGLHIFSKSITTKNLVDGIDLSILDEFVRVLKKIYVYIWCNRVQMFDIMKYFIEKHHCKYQILVWCKTNVVPLANKQFLDDKEFLLCFWQSGVGINLGVNNKSTFYISTLNTSDKKMWGHPTIKPLDFVKQHILNSSQQNDCVLDCFAGSGTTLVACKETGRHYIGFEIDEDYYKIAKERLGDTEVTTTQSKTNLW